jgi:hypothetical protein
MTSAPWPEYNPNVEPVKPKKKISHYVYGKEYGRYVSDTIIGVISGFLGGVIGFFLGPFMSDDEKLD